MAAKTKETDAIVDEEPQTVPVEPTKVYTFPAVIPDADGYYHDARWLKVTCDWGVLKPREGAAPLWAEIDAALTFNEARAIPDPFNTPYVDLAEHVAPRVRAWNAKRVDPATGELVDAAPPSELGMQAFYDVNVYILAWLAYTLKTIHLGGGPNRGNATTPSGGGSDGTSDAT